MAFGFDPGIILATRPADTIGSARSMADLLRSQQEANIQREQHQHTLAAMLQKQQQGQRLADIYRQNAQNPEAVAPALMGAGFGQEAMGWMKHQSEAEARAAAAKQAYQKSTVEGAEFLSRSYRDVRDQPTLDAANDALRKAGWPEESLAMLPREYTPQTVPLIRHFGSLGVSTKDTFEANEAEKRARIMAGAQAAAREQARATGTTIPGLQIAPEAAPTAEDARKVKASLAAAQRMKKYVAELRSLHSKHGTELAGEVGNRMQQLATQILLEGKNIGELGALSGPDMGIIEKIASADPGSLASNLKSLVGIDNTQSNLTGLEQWVDNTLSGNMEAYGYQKAGGHPVAAASAAANSKQPQAGMVRVTNGKDTFAIPEADVADAERDGFRRAP